MYINNLDMCYTALSVYHEHDESNHLKQVQEAYKDSKVPKKDWRKTDWCGKTKKISCKDVRRDAERNKK